MALRTVVAVVVLVVTELQHSAVLQRALRIRSLSVLVETVVLEGILAPPVVTQYLDRLRRRVVAAAVLISALQLLEDRVVERDLLLTSSQVPAELRAKDLRVEILLPRTSPLMAQVAVALQVLVQVE